jgi:hypothetical protein
MDITHFAFAFFVFILVCCSIWVYGRVMRADKKGGKSGYEKEQQLFRLYQNVEDMLSSFEEYVEEAKADLDGRLKQAEAALAGARPVQETGPPPFETKKPAPEEARRPAPEAVKKPAPEEIKRPAPGAVRNPAPELATETKGPKKSEAGGAYKPKYKIEELIPQYIEKGMTKEEIAKALGMASTEVSLIMELKKMGAPGDKA